MTQQAPVLTTSDKQELRTIEEKFEHIRVAVRGIARHYHTGLFLCGEGGTGKSYAVYQALRNLRAKYTLYNSRMTARGLVDGLQLAPIEILLGVTGLPLRSQTIDLLHQFPVGIQVFQLTFDAVWLVFVPPIATVHTPDVEHGLGSAYRPVHARPLHAVLDQVATGPLDRAAGKRLPRRQVFVVPHAL